MEMTKRLDQNSILLRTTTDFHKPHKEYTVDDREFCYAVAKGCTEVLKEYGIYGFRRSTGGEPIILHQLLFIKAYALGDLQARELTAMDKWGLCRKTDFEKEMELLLFDM